MLIEINNLIFYIKRKKYAHNSIKNNLIRNKQNLFLKLFKIQYQEQMYA